MKRFWMVLLVFAVLAFPVAAEDPCDAVCRVETRVAAIRARRAALHAEHLAWLDAVVVTPVAVVIPSYTAPIIVSPGPNAVYGDRSRVTEADVQIECPNAVVISGGETFVWTWAGTLAENEYFQVQLICPNGSYRGIHPPTKELYTVQGGGLRYVVQDCKGGKTRAWGNEAWAPARNIDIEWTIAVIQWDGVDPSRIGAMLAEAAAQWMKI